MKVLTAIALLGVPDFRDYRAQTEEEMNSSLHLVII